VATIVLSLPGEFTYHTKENFDENKKRESQCRILTRITREAYSPL